MTSRVAWSTAIALILACFLGSCGGGSSNPNPVGPAGTGVTLVGTVTDATSGLPIASATVSVQGKSATTGNDGKYSIGDLSAGAATVTVQHQGHTNFSQPVTLTSATTTNITMTASLLAKAAGSWGGQWKDSTSASSSGAAALTLAVDTITQTTQGIVTLGGSVFGLGTPGPQTFSFTYPSPGGTYTYQSGFFGLVTTSVSALTGASRVVRPFAITGSQFTGSMTNVPGGQVSRVNFTGTSTPSQMTINYTIVYNSGLQAPGTVTLALGAPVTVPTLTSVTLVGSSTLTVGQAQQFQAVAGFSDGSTAMVTNQATWSSSNTSVATVGLSTGLVTAVAVPQGQTTGQTTIQATFGGKTGTFNVTVVPLSSSGTTLVNCPSENVKDASDIKRTLFLPSFPGSGLKEVDVRLTARDVTGNYTANMKVTVNGAQVATIGPVTFNVGATRDSVPVAFALPSTLAIAKGSSVRFQVDADPRAIPLGGELAWEGRVSACGAFLTDPAGTVSLSLVPVTIIGAQ